MEKIQNKTLLITGGTGSFGTAVLNRFLHTDHFKEIRIFSRDEKKQDDMRNLYKNDKKCLPFQQNLHVFIFYIHSDALEFTVNNLTYVLIINIYTSQVDSQALSLNFPKVLLMVSI